MDGPPEPRNIVSVRFQARLKISETILIIRNVNAQRVDIDCRMSLGHRLVRLLVVHFFHRIDCRLDGNWVKRQ
jgi:hypothetical protein